MCSVVEDLVAEIRLHMVVTLLRHTAQEHCTYKQSPTGRAGSTAYPSLYRFWTCWSNLLHIAKCIAHAPTFTAFVCVARDQRVHRECLDLRTIGVSGLGFMVWGLGFKLFAVCACVWCGCVCERVCVCVFASEYVCMRLCGTLERTQILQGTKKTAVCSYVYDVYSYTRMFVCVGAWMRGCVCVCVSVRVYV